MASYFHVFSDNRSAIEARVLGAVMMHSMQAARGVVNTEALVSITNTEYKADNVFHYYLATLEKVAEYFSTQRTNGSWSDFQCVLALNIFSTYVKK